MIGFLDSLAALALVIVETVGLPVLVLLFVLNGAIVGKVIPMSVVLPGYVLATGATYRNAFLVVVLVTLAHLAGQLLIYAASRRYGESVVTSLPYVGTQVDSERFQQLDLWFQRHGGLAVFVTNAVPWTRGLIAIPAGIGSYPASRYALYAATPTFLYNTLYALAPVVGLALLY